MSLDVFSLRTYKCTSKQCANSAQVIRASDNQGLDELSSNSMEVVRSKKLTLQIRNLCITAQIRN